MCCDTIQQYLNVFHQPMGRMIWQTVLSFLRSTIFFFTHEQALIILVVAAKNKAEKKVECIGSYYCSSSRKRGHLCLPHHDPQHLVNPSKY